MMDRNYGRTVSEGKKSKKIRTFRRTVIRNLMVGYFVILLLILAFYFNERQLAKKSILESADGTASLYLNELSRQMENVQDRDRSWYAQNNAGSSLEKNNDQLLGYLNAYNMYLLFKEEVSRDEDIKAAFVFYNSLQTARYSASSSFNDLRIRALKSLLAEKIDPGQLTNQWELLFYEDEVYLVHFFGKNGVVVGEVLDFMDLTKDMLGDGNSEVTVIYAGQDGAITNQEQAKELGIPFDSEENSREVQNRFQSRYTILEGKLYLYVAMNAGTGMLRRAGIIFSILFLLATIFGAIGSYQLFRRDMILPLTSMTDTLNRIGSGESEVKMEEERNLEEYNEFGHHFNEMMDQIRDLKIASYEEKMSLEKVYLQMMRLQLKPHFYLNSLTTLYALSQQKKYEILENNIMTISDYIRYSFKNNYEPVPLADELKFAEDTYELRKDSRGIEIRLHINVDESLMSRYVLPFSIQTFVENSIKYAVPEGTLNIYIQAMELKTDDEDPAEAAMEEENRRILDIVVSDDGQGYPEEWLERINAETESTTADFAEDVFTEEKHVGLINLKKRLQLQYHGQAAMFIRNSHGAVSEIMYMSGSGNRSR